MYRDRPLHALEQLLQRSVTKRLAGLCANEEVPVVAAAFRVGAAQQFDDRRRQGHAMLPAHLHPLGRHGPNASLKINLAPAGLKHFLRTRSRQDREC